MAANVVRYIAGGKLFVTPYDNSGSLGTEREICEVSDVVLNAQTEVKDAYTQEDGTSQLVEKAVTKFEATIKFKTQDLRAENLALFHFGAIESSSVAISEALPDGESAAVETTVNTIKAGEKLIAKVKLKFVQKATNNSAKNRVLTVPVAYITPDGDIPYMSEDFMAISFSGGVAKASDGTYYTEEIW